MNPYSPLKGFILIKDFTRFPLIIDTIQLKSINYIPEWYDLFCHF